MGRDLPRPLGPACNSSRLSNSFLGCPSSFIPFANKFPLTQKRLPAIYCTKGGDPVHGKERGGGRIIPPAVPRVLQQNVRSAKGGRGGVAPDHRSYTPEFFRPEGEVQNGNCPDSNSVNSKGGLVHFSRSKGCLFSGPHASPLVQVPSFRLGEEGLPVPDTLLRPVHCPSGFYSYFCSRGLLPPFKRHPSPEVSRRLASVSSFTQSVRNTQGGTFKSLFDSRHSSQSHKVTTYPNSSHYLSGYGNRLCSVPSYTFGQEKRKVLQTSKVVSRVKSANTVRMGFDPRPDVISHVLCKGRPAANEILAAVPEGGQGSRNGNGLEVQGPSGLQGGYPVVVRTQENIRGDLPGPAPSVNLLGNRCFIERLGGSCPDFGRFGLMDRRRETPSHKLLGDKGSTQCIDGLLGSRSGTDSGPSGGQCDSPSLSESRGRDKVHYLPSGSSESPVVGREESGNPSPPVYPGGKECDRRFSVEERGISCSGVVSEYRGMQENMEPVGSPKDRCFRHQGQQTSPGLFLPPTRSPGQGNRCLSSGMEQSVPLFVPSDQDCPQGIDKICPVNGGQRNSGSPLLATTSMVRGPSTSSVRSPKEAPSVAKSSNTNSRRKKVPPRKFYEFTRVEALQYLLGKRKISRKSASLMAKYTRESTQSIYQAKWTRFQDWCRQRKIDPLYTPIPDLIDFFVFLKKQRGLSVSAIEGYRAALTPLFSLNNHKIENSVELNLLFKSFKRSGVRERIRPPHWDINVVLLSLKVAPFEPFREAPLKEMTMKTLFLVALATANRVGEIQALSDQVGFLRDGSVVLSFSSTFLAKTESVSHPVNRDFKIPPLSSITDDRDELLLCPVRAIKYYLKLSACQGRAKSLFVSPRDPTRALSKNACSSFLRGVIRGAYKDVSDRSISLSRVNAHELRGVATSIRYRYNVSHIHLIKSAYWRSNSVFCSCYLRDVAHKYTDISALGPLVVAQGVVQP